MSFGAFTPQWMRNHLTLKGFLFAILLALGGCSAVRSVVPASMPDNATPCPKQKPDACTMEYKPVIGYTDKGEDEGVFSNHCSACREDGIAWTLPKDERE